VANAAAAGAAIAVSPYPLRLRRDRAAWSRYLRFSWPIFVSVFALLVVLQGQVLAFDLADGLAAAGFITLAATLTRYADRVDRILASTIYPAICAVQDRPGTLRELFAKSNRLGLAWVAPFCAGIVLFAPDLVEFALGDEWEPAVGLLQGLAVAAGLQQLGYNWFSFYRAAGESRPQAVEAVVMAAAFLLLAVPALFAWGFDGFVAGRIAGAVLVLGVRRHYVRRLLPDMSLVRLAARGLMPVAAAAALVVAVRFAVGGDREAGQAIAEALLFAAATAGFTWLLERPLLREAGTYLRRAPGSAPAPTA
jgi:O-antigen/teichoic acid export membrane protein